MERFKSEDARGRLEHLLINRKRGPILQGGKARTLLVALNEFIKKLEPYIFNANGYLALPAWWKFMAWMEIGKIVTEFVVVVLEVFGPAGEVDKAE